MSNNTRHFSIVGVLILVVTGIIYLLLSGDIIGFGFFQRPDAASAEASPIDTLFVRHYWLIAFLFAVVIVPFFYSFFAFSQEEGDDTDAPHIHGNTSLEIAWTVIPLIFVALFGVWGFTTYTNVIAEEPNEVIIRTQGYKWDWNFYYPELDDAFSNTLVLRVNEPIALEMQSQDVIHAFWIPEFRVKQDVVPYNTQNPALNFSNVDLYDPSLYNYEPQVIRFTPVEEGVYRLRCAEICGTAHYAMLANVIVLNDATYQKWVDGEYMVPPDPLFTNAQPDVEGYYLKELEENFTLSGGYVPPEPPAFGGEAESEG